MNDYPKGKQLLIELASNIAKQKHPEGYNKKQLIDASKEVYGGFATNPFKQIKTREDINHKRNSMANIDGHYPLNISGCEVVGISSDCGRECPVLLDGECDEEEEMLLQRSDCASCVEDGEN